MKKKETKQNGLMSRLMDLTHVKSMKKNQLIRNADSLKLSDGQCLHLKTDGEVSEGLLKH